MDVAMAGNVENVKRAIQVQSIAEKLGSAAFLDN
jgi:hypothetical protein